MQAVSLPSTTEELIEHCKTNAILLCGLISQVHEGRITSNDAIEKAKAFLAILNDAADKSTNKIVFMPLIEFCGQVLSTLRRLSN